MKITRQWLCIILIIMLFLTACVGVSQTEMPTLATPLVTSTSTIEQPTPTIPSNEFNITIEEVAKEDNSYFNASYVYVDITVPNIHMLQTYVGKGTISELAEEADALFAINGVFWNHNNASKYIVHNGQLVHKLETKSVRDYWVIYNDGSMEAIQHKDIKSNNDFPNNIWQVYTFGPSLIHDGELTIDYSDIFDRNISDYSHNRTAIGYFEPNHFCVLIVAGRNNSDHGAYLEQMAQFFLDKGCVEAYNLDGGGSSHLWYNGKEYGHPSEDRRLADIYFIPKDE